jgi:hypothetical protein
MKLNVLFNPGQSCTFSTFPPSSKCSFWPGLPCTFSPPILWRGGGGSLKCSFSTRAVCTFSPLPVGRGGVSNVLFKLGQFVPSHLCLWGGGGILNVPFKPRQIVSFHLCLGEGGGGIFIDFPYGDYIMSWFTLSILYIIFSSFALIPSCERLINILFILFQLDKARVQ